MSKENASKERAMVYIDGFNLYFGLKSLVLNSTKKGVTKNIYWLDLFSLAEKIVQNRDLVGVKYFTARIKGDHAKQSRQSAFLAALQTYRPEIEIYEGRYLFRKMFCRKCRKFTEDVICPKCKVVSFCKF